jgi:hypothetical protein
MAPLPEKLLRSYSLPIPVVACPKGLDCGHSIAAIAGSIPAEGMDVSSVVCCVGSGLCDELITRSEESYRVCVSVCLSYFV